MESRTYPATASSDRDTGGPGRFDRLRRYLTARPWILDSLVWALPVTFFGVLTAVSIAQTNVVSMVPPFVQIAIALLQTVPLALRRTRPLLSSSVIASGFLLGVITMTGPNLGVIAVPLTVFSTTAWGSRVHGRIVLGLGLTGSVLLGGWIYLVLLQSTIGPGSRPLEAGSYLLLGTVVALSAAIVLIAWLLGGVGYRRRRELESIWERNRLLEQERESETRLAADAERMRIAREMHDVIAHSLSVIIAQADGGRFAAKADPDKAAEVLETIAGTGRDALAQTRSLLGFLRSDEDSGRTAAPLPAISDLDSLVSDLRSAGLAVSLVGVETVKNDLLPDGASLAVYRIVQEALTNVLKHAGSGARAHVSLQLDGDDLITRISDDGGGAGGAGSVNGVGGAGAQGGRGHGIVGMRERASLYGGSLTARPIRSTGVGRPGGKESGRGTVGQDDSRRDVPGFASGNVPGHAFGSTTGFLVEARFPVARRLGAAPASVGEGARADVAGPSVPGDVAEAGAPEADGEAAAPSDASAVAPSNAEAEGRR
ncbi:sensor histidine kinase [Brevibacterium atlanticum]|uniref:sensor histidine kinase n=1 Tax=Brevibacterium atlanticum TaxID=2697563 RepID=UPI0014211702|nr:histidine kinase [Brevibacterium atlanticum]